VLEARRRYLQSLMGVVEVWEWEDEQGHWQEYSDDAQELIQKAAKAGKQSVELKPGA
jgi:hypothetical protein